MTTEALSIRREMGRYMIHPFHGSAVYYSRGMALNFQRREKNHPREGAVE